MTLSQLVDELTGGNRTTTRNPHAKDKPRRVRRKEARDQAKKKA